MPKQRRGRGDGTVYQKHDHPSCPSPERVTDDDGTAIIEWVERHK